MTAFRIRVSVSVPFALLHYNFSYQCISTEIQAYSARRFKLSTDKKGYPPYTSTLPPSSSLVIFVILDIPRSTTVIRSSSSPRTGSTAQRETGSHHIPLQTTPPKQPAFNFSSSSCKQSREREMEVESYLSHYTFIPCFVV